MTERTIIKVLQSGFWWPTLFKDYNLCVQECLESQKIGKISKRDEMPLNGMIKVEPFNSWGIDFMDPFPPSNSHVYILVHVDYVTKWVEVVACVANNAQIVFNFLKKNVFDSFKVPRVLICEGGNISEINN